MAQSRSHTTPASSSTGFKQKYTKKPFLFFVFAIMLDAVLASLYSRHQQKTSKPTQECQKSNFNKIKFMDCYVRQNKKTCNSQG